MAWNKERYHSDPEYRAHRLKLNSESEKRRRARARAEREANPPPAKRKAPENWTDPPKLGRILGIRCGWANSPARK